ncbi:MAG: HAD family hydrolase [Ignavibacteria bacterium]
MSGYKKNRGFDFTKIKLILTDIDGVWTDGGVYYTEEGMAMKCFNVKDGIGVDRLRDQGIETGIITGDDSVILQTRARKLGIDLVYTGIAEKTIVLDKICALRGLSYENIAYIGDDVNDLGVMARAGFTAAPVDAVDDVINAVDYVCSRRGGEGAFREFADIIIKNRDKMPSLSA